MGSIRWLLPLVFLLAVWSSSARHCYVVFPNVLRLGVQETVAISVEGVNVPQAVHVFIQDFPGKRKNFSAVTVNVGEEPQITHIRVTPQDIPELDIADPNAKHYVSVVAYSVGWFRKEAQLLVSPQAGYVYIQTDKPIYTPKHTVKIRVIQLDENTLPSDYDITLQIRNPQGITVGNEHFTAKKNFNRKRFLPFVFQLPPSPLIGEWSAVVLYGPKQELNSTVTFEVREYVLPTFSVKLKTPDVVLPQQENIKVSVEANYVYGKTLKGTAIFKFAVIDEIGNSVSIGSSETKELEDGTAEFTLGTNMIKKRDDIGWFNGIDGKRLFVEVIVVDQASGNRETAAEDKTLFSRSPYKISFKRCVKDYKPGLVAMILADITFANGRPAPLVNAIITAVDDHRRPMKIKNPAFISDEEGRVSFSVNTELDNSVHSFIATVKTNDERYSDEYQASGSVTLSRYVSKTNAYISLVRTDGTTPVKPNDRFIGNVFADPPGEISDIYYVVVSRGKILISSNLLKGRFKEHRLDFIVTTEMVPSIRIIAYTIHKGELIADSIKVEVENQCMPHTEVKLKEEFDVKEPGVAGKIVISGSKDTLVGLLAVDEAVYALRNKDKLTKEKMFKEMEAHDMGCGPGGGGNTDLVLANAGVVILSDSTEQTSRRSAIGCEERRRRKREVIDSIVSMYEGRPYQCCHLGMLPDRYERSCEERAEIVHKFLPDDDEDGCSNAFLDCCTRKSELHKFLAQRTMLYNKETAEDEYRKRGFDIGPEDLIDFTDERDEEDILKNTLVRNDFRETWLFEDLSIGPNGKEEFATTLPHSITTWVIQAVSLSPEFGMCVAVPQKVAVTKKVFLQLNLPYSVIRGEQVEIKATVFNYGQHRLPVKVFMFGAKDLCTGYVEGEKSERKKIYIDPQSAENVVFPVVPLKEGTIDIRIAALSNDGSDVIVRQLNVVPEGETVIDSVSIVLDPTNQQRRAKRHIIEQKYSDTIDESQKLQVTTVKLQPERDYIPGTESCIISAIGDTFGPSVATSLSDPERMLLQPIGCGEQTMMFLGPTLYTMHYLKVTDQITPDIEAKGYGFIRNGYNRELTYRKPDGSYAAFPGRPSSVWLTAFVMKVFCQAKSLVHIDDNVICSGMKWLLSQQQPDGSFIDQNPVIHRDMMGKVDGQIPMTAFVLISLHECTCDDDMEIAQVRAMAFLEENLPVIKEPFQLSLVAYALALADSEFGPVANEQLRQVSQYDEGTNRRYWTSGNSPSIEATSYSLLTQLKYNDIEFSNAIVNWLNNQKTPSGSFSSTQDTVLAIQALSEYSIKSRSPPVNLLCNVTSSNDRNFVRTMRFAKENALVMQELEVKKVGGTLFFTTTGEGIGQLSVKLKYNIPRPPGKLCKFDVSITTTEVKEEIAPNVVPVARKVEDEDKDGFQFVMLPEDLIRALVLKQEVLPNEELPEDPPEKKFAAKKLGIKLQKTDDRNRDVLLFKRSVQNDDDDDEDEPAPDVRGRAGGNKFALKVSICVKYLGNHNAGMTVLDVGIFTGFEPVKDDLKQLVKDEDSVVQRFEVSKNGVVFYLDYTPNDAPYCMSFKIKREYIVPNIQPRVVKIYDYYRPDESCSRFYSPSENSPLLKIVCEGHVCQCAEGGCPPAEPFSHVSRIAADKGNEDAQTFAKETLQKIACDEHDYVWKGKVTNKRSENGFRFITFNIMKVLKAGIEPAAQLEGEERTLIARDNCKTADLPINEVYVLMGKDGEKFEGKDGELWYRYIIDKSTSIYMWKEFRVSPDKQLFKVFRWLQIELLTNGCGL